MIMVLEYVKPNNSIKDRGAVDKSTVEKNGFIAQILSRKRGNRRRHQAKDVLDEGNKISSTVAVLRSAIIIVKYSVRNCYGCHFTLDAKSGVYFCKADSKLKLSVIYH